MVTLKLRQITSNAQNIQGEYQVITADGVQLSAKVTLTINDKSVRFSGCNSGSG